MTKNKNKYTQASPSVHVSPAQANESPELANALSGELQNNEAAPEEDPADAGETEPVVEMRPVSARITSEESAKAHVLEHYEVPEGTKEVLVTEDRNVFWPDNESSAVNHAQRNNLKLFRIQWD